MNDVIYYLYLVILVNELHFRGTLMMRLVNLPHFSISIFLALKLRAISYLFPKT